VFGAGGEDQLLARARLLLHVGGVLISGVCVGQGARGVWEGVECWVNAVDLYRARHLGVMYECGGRGRGEGGRV
jgi:hypothetical protein